MDRRNVAAAVRHTVSRQTAPGPELNPPLRSNRETPRARNPSGRLRIRRSDTMPAPGGHYRSLRVDDAVQ